MTVRISELTELTADLSQSDVLPIVDVSASETKQITVANLLQVGIEGGPSSFIDLSKLNQDSSTKLSPLALSNTGVASGVYGNAAEVTQLTINSQGLVTSASGLAINIAASQVTGLALVATSGTYASLSGLPTLGTLSSQDANSVAISGGTISGVVFASDNVAIGGGVVSGITDLSISDGGTGASTAENARTNLGLAIGADVQAYSAVLSGISEQFDEPDEIAYAVASGVIASTPFTAFARAIVSGSTAGEVRTTLGLGTVSVQNAGSVAISGGTISGISLFSSDVGISGGTISGITDLAIADGGTGASTAEDARANLGLVIGSNVQAYSNVLSDIAAQFDEPDEIVYASASGVVTGTPFTAFARSIISGSTASQVRDTLELGSIAIQNAGSVAISGGTISGVSFSSSGVIITGGTISGIADLSIEDGGTGASDASSARTNLGLAIGTNIQGYSDVLSDIVSSANNSDLFFYTTASGAVASAAFSDAARSIVAPTTISGIRNALELGTLATLSELVVGSGNIAPDSITTEGIVDGAVVSSKVAFASLALDRLTPIAPNTLLGRATDSGTVEQIPCSPAARLLLAEESNEDIRETLGLGTLATQDGIFSGESSGTNTGDQTITLTGDVTGTGTETFETTIADDAITELKIADGAVSESKLADDAVSASKLADNSGVIVSSSVPVGDGAFVGQQWINTNTGYEYTWTGSAWLRLQSVADITFVNSSPLTFSATLTDPFTAEITVGQATQEATTVLAGPVSGENAVPAYRALLPSDLPVATAEDLGISRPGTGLVVADGIVNHSNTVSSGVFNGISFDDQGHITAAVPLVESDIPSLNASKITDGQFATERYADDSVTGEKLADYSTAKIGETLPVADYTGQIFFNPLAKNFFLWDGNVWQPIGISVGAIIFGGTYNASGNVVQSVTTDGEAIGLVVGSGLPEADGVNKNYYVVVAIGGTGVAPAPATVLEPPDLLLSNGSDWFEIDVSSTFVAQTASQVGFTPAGEIGSTNVQSAIEEVSNECRDASNIASGTLAVARGGTNLSSYTKGDLIVASGTTVLAKLGAGSNGQRLEADSAEPFGLKWATPTSGTVTSVESTTAALVVASGTSTTAPSLSIASASTTASGVVMLTDSTGVTSSVLAATATAVKTVADVANGAMQASGATATGPVRIGTTGSLLFEGSVDNGTRTTLTVANPTTARTITLPDETGTVVTSAGSGVVTSTMILDGTIVNADINASAAIGLSKLATGALPSGITVASTNIVDGTIVNADINVSAAIALSKLATGALPSGITVASANIVDGTIVNADINASAAIADTKLATISTGGKVSNSATTATSANTASAIVARDASGNFSAGTITAALTGNADTSTKLSSSRTFALTGDITGTVSSDLTSGASIATAIATGAIVDADVSASAAIAHSKLAALNSANIIVGSSTNVPTARAVTGDVTISNTGVTAIAAGAIVNADISASAAIADTKLATIATAGKVSNSATTADSANTASAIVARDGSGNFTAGTITAALTGAASSNVLKAGDTMTGALLHPLGTAAAPSIAFTGDTNTGIFSPGADQVAVATNGSGRLFINSSGQVGINGSPVQPLHVFGNIRIGSNTTGAQYSNLSVFGTAGIQDASPLLNFNPADGSTRFGYINHAGAGGSLDILNQENGALTLGAGNTERLRITSAGLVGIGTSSPFTTLHSAKSITGGAPATTGTTDANVFSRFQGGSVGLDIGGTATGLQWIQPRDVNNFAVNYGLALCPNGGSVGIGTTSPSFLLDVAGSARLGAATGDVALEVGAGASVNRNALIDFVGDTTYTDYGLRIIRANGGANADSKIQHRGTGRLIIEAQDAASTVFFNGGTERARIDSSGRLLVGTSSARDNYFNSTVAPKLQVEGGTSGEPIISIVRNADDVFASHLLLSKTRGAGNVIVADGDTIGSVGFQGNDGTEFVIAATIEAQVDGTPGADDMPGRLVFSTTAGGSATPTERMRISQNGGILVNTTSPDPIGSSASQSASFGPGASAGAFNYYNASATCMKLGRGNDGSLIDFFRNQPSATVVGSISVTTTATAYNTSSDYRLKENVVDLDGAIDRLKQLPVHRFNFIADPDTVVDGFIAHEAAEVVPECVTGTKDEVDEDGNPQYQGIDQSKLVPLLTAALQEAIGEIESLKARLDAANL